MFQAIRSYKAFLPTLLFAATTTSVVQLILMSAAYDMSKFSVFPTLTLGALGLFGLQVMYGGVALSSLALWWGALFLRLQMRAQSLAPVVTLIWCTILYATFDYVGILTLSAPIDSAWWVFGPSAALAQILAISIKPQARDTSDTERVRSVQSTVFMATLFIVGGLTLGIGAIIQVATQLNDEISLESGIGILVLCLGIAAVPTSVLGFVRWRQLRSPNMTRSPFWPFLGALLSTLTLLVGAMIVTMNLQSVAWWPIWLYGPAVGVSWHLLDRSRQSIEPGRP